MKPRTAIIIVLLLALGVYAYIQINGDGDDSSDDVLDLSDDDGSSDDSLDDDAGDDTGSSDMTKSGLVAEWAKLIQTYEGWFPGSRSYRNNNPGNLVEQGDMGTDADGYAVFDSYASGLQALEDDLSAKLRKYPSLSIQAIMARYAPSPDGTKLNAGNNPLAYAQNIATGLASFFSTGITTSTTLSQLVGMTQG